MSPALFAPPRLARARRQPRATPGGVHIGLAGLRSPGLELRPELRYAKKEWNFFFGSCLGPPAKTAPPGRPYGLRSYSN